MKAKAQSPKTMTEVAWIFYMQEVRFTKCDMCTSVNVEICKSTTTKDERSKLKGATTSPLRDSGVCMN